ncbi:VRR-NUC domain-containing protein [Escherichia coli]|uniref:VRR-NUC domain-containing protein n=1 Tax=Escherichia coli TaxID=562 RepID=UPI001852672F|nr:VRR-NUC domain-containing protein [Escherichia coli]EKI3096579.1 VRR-NUC domain-containing protein [Escherichia coli]MBB9841078.1 VRR-NUC domain-containing protein [Escherichia coli]MBS9328504.1 VRR-NUC domain-containing protein [Escherichia coli]
MSRHLFSVEWLEGHKQRMKAGGRKRAAAITDVPADMLTPISLYDRLSESPHLKALNVLARNPGLLDRNAEHYEQVRVFWHMEQYNPALYARLHSTPNGGMRSDATAWKMKAEGQKAGYPDLSLDVPRGRYHGMRLELKFGKNRVSEHQKHWLRMLSDDGYYCCVAYGHQQAIELLMAYWQLSAGAEMPTVETDAMWRLAKQI